MWPRRTAWPSASDRPEASDWAVRRAWPAAFFNALEHLHPRENQLVNAPGGFHWQNRTRPRFPSVNNALHLAELPHAGEYY